MQSTDERSNPDADRTEADEKKSLEEKLWSSPLFWICMVLALSLIGAAIAVGTYFILVDGAKTNETDGPDPGPDKDDTGSNGKTCRPSRSNYTWVKDVPMLYESPDGESYKLSIYSGAATYNEMKRVCSRIVRKKEDETEPPYSYIYFPNKGLDIFPIALFCPKLNQYQWIADIKRTRNGTDGYNWISRPYNGSAKYEEMQQVCDSVDGKPAPESYHYLPSYNHSIPYSLFCADVNQHKWIADVKKIKTSSDGMNWIEEDFLGAYEYKQLISFCSKMLRLVTLPGQNTIKPSSIKEEEAIDQIVKQHKEVLFNDKEENNLLWTGYYFWRADKRPWDDTFNASNSYNLFCYPANFREDIETFKKSYPFIYVAKDYRVSQDDHACWQLLSMLSDEVDVSKEEEIYPVRLPFVCKSKLSDGSGASALAGSSWDILRVNSTVKPGWEYLVTQFQATYSEAIKECDSLDAKLVSGGTDANKEEVKKLILDTMEFRSYPDYGGNVWAADFVDLLTYKGVYYKELVERAKAIQALEECDDSRRYYVHHIYQPDNKNPKKIVYAQYIHDAFIPDAVEGYVICERKIK